ncbi:MAG: 4-alpha-glucanotransferase [Bacteriovorax sp.]|jgi:4-alpha-glucanotransferase
MDQNKHSGILCHITSLPTDYGIGDFGPCAYKFVDELALAKQTHWQMLPTGNTNDSGCPYSTDSAFGCADFYVSPELLIKDFNLQETTFRKYYVQTEKVDFKNAKINKQKILEVAYQNFNPDKKYYDFLLQEKTWLTDYCQFRTLSETRGHDWREWGSVQLSSVEMARVEFHQFCQYACFSQLARLKQYANGKNVKLVGDLPIFVSYQSMDVWKNPRQFFLNEKMEMEYETGAAPDSFSITGQKWGTPIYNWDAQKEDNYEWWNQRLSFLKRYFDVIRIDHFRGFCATWISKILELDASGGHWFKGPGAELFNQLRDYPEIIAEDLGFITADVDQLRDQFNFPGMKVFQFLLGDSSNPHKLSNYHFNSVAYSGTHDCDTLMGWFHNLSETDRANVECELKMKNPSYWDMLKVLLHTPAKLVFIQIQDLLGLGTEARFNYPGTVEDTNWTWKLKKQDLDHIDWKKLAELTEKSGRGNVRQACG